MENGNNEHMTEHTTNNAMQGHLLGAADIRRIADEAGISPTKKFGQNFVIDPGTVRRIVREAAVTADDRSTTRPSSLPSNHASSPMPMP